MDHLQKRLPVPFAPSGNFIVGKNSLVNANAGRNQEALVNYFDNTSWSEMEHVGLISCRLPIPIGIAYPRAADD